MPHDGIVRIARHEEDARIGSHRGDALRQDAAVDSRHHDVGQQQVNRRVVAARDSERLLSMHGFEHRVARLPKAGSDERDDARIVFDEQDGLRSA